ncbi:MAG: phosphotransferase family protein, partial [Candidatus Hydrogenedentota bacterium]
MELDELQTRLGPFVRAKLNDPAATVSNVYKMPGHAGFSYGFSTHDRNGDRHWYLRLPPPNVQWKGTADVLRQVEVLNALDATDVPHCSVTWSGDDLEWFGRPYFVVPKLEGDTARTGPDSWVAQLSPETRRDMARQTMHALAGVHKVDWQRATPYLGAPIPFDSDVTRWDTFYERAAEPQMLARAPEVKAALLAQLPSGAPLGVFHGDFQWGNMFFSREGKLLAIIDWELTGLGSTLNDVGWIATFSDPAAWPTGGGNG